MPFEIPRRLADALARDGSPEQRAWLDELPDTVADLANRWGLRVGPAFEPGGVTGWVAPATRGAQRVVIKITWRGDERVESRDEAEGLAVWGGRGAVRLLDRHNTADTGALLLEACEPGAALSARPESEQDVVVAGLLRRLWLDPPPDHPFRDLAAMCAWWADEAEERARGSLRGDRGLIRAGLELFRSLPLDPVQPVVLTTDLHADNILAAAREPWLMIDPKPYVGDRHYDVLQHMLNCPDRLLRAEPLDLVERMAELVDLDANRLRLWAFARCVQESANQPDLLDVARRLAP